MSEHDDKILKELIRKDSTQCVVSGITYDNVMKLQKILRKKGVDCNVVAGGFAIYANYQDPRVISACKKFKTVAEPGVSRHISDTLLGQKEVDVNKTPFPTIDNPE